MTDRHTLLAGLCATLVAPVPAHATTTITDDAAPASILLYTFAPELMPGWTRTPKLAQCAFLGAAAFGRPEIGCLTRQRDQSRGAARSEAGCSLFWSAPCYSAAAAHGRLHRTVPTVADPGPAERFRLVGRDQARGLPHPGAAARRSAWGSIPATAMIPQNAFP
jgi:hypothetical protein